MTERSIAVLKAQRGNAKRMLTNFLKFLDAFEYEKDYPILEKRLQEIENQRAIFDTCQLELEQTNEDPAHETTRDEFDEKYYRAVSKATTILQNIPRQMTQLATSSNHANSERQPIVGKRKLPPVNLPTFDGSYESWIGFHDLFQSVVDADRDTTEIEKFYHLKGCLRDEAVNVIAALELSAENYKVAWNLLKDRYNNRKIIRRKHVNALLNLPFLSKEYSIRSFLDYIQKHIRALQALKEPIENWDTLLIGIVSQKLNPFLREKWEDFSNDSEQPTYQELISFLQRRAQLEDTQVYQKSEKSQSSVDKKSGSKNSRSQQSCATSVSKSSCTFCDGDHQIYSCVKFRKLTPQARFDAAKKASLCLNCLRKNHRVAECTLSPCRKCNQKHNIFLHFEKSIAEPSNTVGSEDQEIDMNKKSLSCGAAQVPTEALLATAIVDLVNDQGKTKTCRVFLDGGSQANFVTEEVAKFLNLHRTSVGISVSGINDISTEVKHLVYGTVKSRFNNYQKRLDFLVLPQITNDIPSIPIKPSILEIPKNIQLADPDFYQPGKIDLLIGVKVFFKLMCLGQIPIKEQPNAVFQKTHFGWIVAGELKINSFRQNEVKCHVAISSPYENLAKFFELEEIPIKKLFSPEEELCEKHFCENIQRLENGKYQVRLPFNEKKGALGESRVRASRCLNSLIKRFENSPELKKDYSEFLENYEMLEHMTELKENELDKPKFYFPHHPVVRQESLTTKLRVVFNGSSPSSSGVSLNDTFLTGPALQNDLFSLLIRFRSHKYALTADIEKMYRQIPVHPDDVAYQNILFRKTFQEPIKIFSLNTVTYGTSCAPYLALRVLKQLAEDERLTHPVAATVLEDDFYVDDVLTGCQTIKEAKILRDELIILLKKGGFTLRKWASNEPSLLFENSNKIETTHMSLDKDSSKKTLGVQSDCNRDVISYVVNLSETCSQVTKRSILSEISKIFDPYGLLGPVIITAKIMIQDLWKVGCSWDESVPLNIHTKWVELRNQLPLLEKLNFDRFMSISNPIEIQMHGFCDASEKAYGACIYLRSTDNSGNHHISIVCAKSKVAPVSPVTLPRLELCAALLLSRLYNITKNSLSFENQRVFFWSDSTIVLQWLKTDASTLKTFVSNRISEIQTNTKNGEWKHVPSQDNPADLISRGKFPTEILESTLWKKGPTWLSRDEHLWPNKIISVREIPEKKKVIASTICLKLTIRDRDLLKKYSSLLTLQKIIAFIFRFINNAKNKESKIIGPILPVELENSLSTIIRLTQSTEFANEIKCLKNGTFLSLKSKLLTLNPFLDTNGILRVGGRLAHSDLLEKQKHPILMPYNHHITRVLIRDEHLRLHHAGAQATLYSIRENYWPLNGRNLTRNIIKQCVPCFRAKPRPLEQFMSNLPQDRVSGSRPFLNVGVDYCGPLYIKEKRFRNRNKIKVYISLFVCMATKAVHLEVVSDLSTEAFIAALKRLFSRRGKAKAIYSDNATNFLGASRELNELYNLVQAPHFGGLWEAAVKSFKHHFSRIVGDTLLTFEQLETYTIEIEAILNSRPISPMSSDPNDLHPLTPGHFLIGGPLTSFPQADLITIPSNRLSNWQHAQQLRQHFWKRWSKEYLHQLITRNKWSSGSSSNIHVGQLVIIKEDNAPPLQWTTGRITATFPGQDGLIRVVMVKTKTGEYKRCIQNLCLLPIE
ncbi:uncharacterized protein LOC127284933 [Leptopilina boulardi]|uniref:uncharacterized protein LOC127284933 n=1 Tax=Leptopilina boulardi TaxID=63433 RepID=UPI0021F587AA|nr:uncharacterized protein LOC127284933 [Leptopilina boulardi]